jgi:hypothetical protein
MTLRPHPDDLFAAKKKKKIPFEFVLDELEDLEPRTRPMFGCTAVYVEGALVFSRSRREGSALKNLADALHNEGGCTLSIGREVKMEIPVNTMLTECRSPKTANRKSCR